MVWIDPIVDQIRKARAEMVAPFGEDIHAFFEYLRAGEREHPDPPVVLEPNAPDPVDVHGTPSR